MLSAGRQVEGTWHKAGRDARFTFTDAAGKPLLVAPGRTWIELVPDVRRGAGLLIRAQLERVWTASPTPVE